MFISQEDSFESGRYLKKRLECVNYAANVFTAVYGRFIFILFLYIYIYLQGKMKNSIWTTVCNDKKYYCHTGEVNLNRRDV